MSIDEYNCYIPESIFLGDNETILNEYPFNDSIYDNSSNDNKRDQ